MYFELHIFSFLYDLVCIQEGRTWYFMVFSCEVGLSTCTDLYAVPVYNHTFVFVVLIFNWLMTTIQIHYPNLLNYVLLWSFMVFFLSRQADTCQVTFKNIDTNVVIIINYVCSISTYDLYKFSNWTEIQI